MEDNIKGSDSAFRGTYKYYVEHRPNIPKEVIDVIVDHFNIKKTDRVLDMGCGTGQVALAMEGRCAEMVCLDPDPEMISKAKKATKDFKTKLFWINLSAEDLGKIKEEIGSFKVATVSRAFHRMNQDLVLRHLDELIDKNGGVAAFSDSVIWKGDKEWQMILKKIIHKHLEKANCAGKGKTKASYELWENILARSAFNFVETYSVPDIRNWDIESIIGYVFSTSVGAPYLFGDQLEEFKEETKNTLLSINPKGMFQENVVWRIVLGSRNPRN